MKIMDKNVLLSILIGINVALFGIINSSKGTQSKAKEAREMQAQIIQRQEIGIITQEQLNVAANIARSCSNEINSAMDEIERKNWAKASNHVINAKGHLVKLRELGIPVEDYQKNIETLRNLIYAAHSGEINFT